MSRTDPALLPDVSASETPLQSTFRIKLNGQPISIGTVGQAFRFITSLSAIEWMEFRRECDADGAGDECAARVVCAGEVAVTAGRISDSSAVAPAVAVAAAPA
jgi:hypothetical protein